MNNLYKKLGIKVTQVVKPIRAKAKGKETHDTEKVKEARQLMNNTYKSKTKLINGSYLQPIYKRDENNKFLLDKQGNKVVSHYEPKKLIGDFILDDNHDGTFTATKLNVYKETYIIDGESLEVTKVTNN